MSIDCLHDTNDDAECNNQDFLSDAKDIYEFQEHVVVLLL
jgi:hypothetical protein